MGKGVMISAKSIAASLMVVFSFVGCSQAQTYEETVNYIFNGNKTWSSVNWSIFSSKLSNYDQSKCTVDIDTGGFISDITKGKISLYGMQNFSFNERCMRDDEKRRRVCHGYTGLRIESKGKILTGVMKPDLSNATLAFLTASVPDCSGSCEFPRPSVEDAARLSAAFEHLWTKFCPRGERTAF